MGLFWQGCWSARSVVAVEVNGYTIEPGAKLAECYQRPGPTPLTAIGSPRLRGTR